jgi:16S rRNA C1402 (ribose-2'-O) methylase RsmI
LILYILICLSLSLAGITGLQFFYLAYLDRLDKDQKRRIRELEQHCQHLTNQLHVAETTLAEFEAKSRKKLLSIDEEDDNEVWADVIGEA